MVKEKIYLFDHSPHLKDEWDYSKNSVTPSEITYASRKSVWWVCPENHSYDMKVSNKVFQSLKCPICSNRRVLAGYNDLLTTHPQIASELKDKSLATTLGAGSNKSVNWVCSKGHEWVAMPISRTRRGDGCGYCSRKRLLSGYNDLGTMFPELALQMVDPSQAKYLSTHSKKKVLWLCQNNHEYTSSVANRQKGRGCPVCSGRTLVVGVNDLSTTHPELASELFYMNDADKFTVNTTVKLAWKCVRGHQYWQTPQRRISAGYGCPFCSSISLLVGYNDIATTEPELSAQLLDKSLSTKIMRSSGKKVEWICQENHIWAASPNSRSNKNRPNGCPSCSMNQKSRSEDRLKEILSSFFNDVTKPTEKARVPVTGYAMKSRSVDVMIPLRDSVLIVEYDGSYWHFGKEDHDSQKTSNLLDNGYLVVRIREQSAYKLGNLDLNHKNLFQTSVDYTNNNDHLLNAVLEIIDWLEKDHSDRLL